MSHQVDIDIIRNIRRVFVRHWIDLGRLHIHCMNGKIRIRGILQRIPGIQEALAPAIIGAIFKEIKRLKNVRIVNTDIENWTEDNGMWHPVDKEESKSSFITYTKPQCYDLDKEEKLSP